MDSVTDDGFLIRRVSPFGNLRIDAYVPLPGAYRSLSRPSSAPDAKAFPLCSLSLDLLVLKNYAGSIRFPSVEIAVTQLLQTLPSVAFLSSLSVQFSMCSEDQRYLIPQIGAQRSGSDLERKKEPTDMQFSRRLRKPRKRNGVGFF